jgi:cyclomaltodextrinase / maltogenic alpha-amylase / neopullulanase
MPRILTIAGLDKTAVRLMFLCQMTVPGAPNIYYGDEIGMAGRHDPDCRRAFPWDDESAWDHELRAYVKDLIALRHKTAALRRGTFQILYANEHVLMYQREYEGQTAVIAFNSAEHEETIIAPPGFAEPLAEQLTNPGKAFVEGESYPLNGRSGRIWTS